jgi:hypothetical protein
LAPCRNAGCRTGYEPDLFPSLFMNLFIILSHCYYFSKALKHIPYIY